ncbi:Glu/Leu/Phe/Val dehydrogenase dimerization domain-containing protein [Companilactobacillus insicii]|uniref:Glu/Leu/Phe/Val dehydrogenase dimerization domain-containing protein n=1 Tax=Companilactobacillus insicii TaxID=1732567 RepID=UPI000F7B5132|nr:Glu/Leu/Phe/Val dehydrogenase dimerization domain-containing protein [Companilactobacillus insicii]
MNLFEVMTHDDYEQVVFCQDKVSGLKAIIAIHDTTLGPALGGCRMWPYASEEEALNDALRLAKGMTYKNAAAGLNIGGAKTVVIGDPKKDKNEALFRALGRYIESLNGRYITAEDVGTTVDDMNAIYMETNHVTGTSDAQGASGNPSPVTALGVYYAMKRTAKEAFGDDNLTGKTVSIQGAGNVATGLAKHLNDEGAHIIVTDINQDAIDRMVNDYGATAVAPDEIYDVDADIFAPCALGAILNDDTIPRLKVKAVCGSSNNQLLDIEKHGQMLKDRGIVYGPDFIVNAGGVINVADELKGYDRDRALEKVKTIYDQMDKVFAIAKRDNITTAEAADRLAEERINSILNVRGNFLQNEKSSLKTV